MAWPTPAPDNGFLESHAALLVASFRNATGRDLLNPALAGVERATALFQAPFVVVSHNTDPDPCFNYGNQAALDLFEMTWEELTALPSRMSAEPMHRDERARLMAKVARQGFIDDYQGIRISRSGRRFRIEHATVWNLWDDSGNLRGQAAAFSQWTPVV